MAFSRSKTRRVVGLDIESGFIAAAELSTNGSPTLQRAATGELTPGVFNEGEVIDADGLAEQLKVFFTRHKLPKRVRLGLASQRVALRVLELPVINDPKELAAAVRFQAQEELPMPLEQAVLDHRVLERIDDGETGRMRVLVVGARRDSVERLLAATKRAGLVPELVDLSAFAMVRALHLPLHADQHDSVNEHVNVHLTQEAARERSHEEHVADEHPVDHDLGEDAGAADPFGERDGDQAHQFGADGFEAEGPDLRGEPAVIYCYVGGATNLAIAAGTSCVFNRVLPNGAESMAATLAERKGLTLEHARQWLRHVGLDRDIDTIDGEREIVAEARTVLERGAARIADDVRLSLEYYQAAVVDARRVERMVMAGPGIALEGLPRTVEAKLGLPVVPRSLGNIQVVPGALEGVDASQLTVAAGLALDEVAA